MRYAGIILCIAVSCLHAQDEADVLKRKRTGHQRHERKVVPRKKQHKISHERDIAVAQSLLYNPEGWMKPLQKDIEVMYAISEKANGMPLHIITSFVARIQHVLRSAYTCVSHGDYSYKQQSRLVNNIANFKIWLPAIQMTCSNEAMYSDITVLSHVLRAAFEQRPKPAYTLAQAAFMVTQFSSPPLRHLQTKYAVSKAQNEDMAYAYRPYTQQQLDSDIEYAQNALYNAGAMSQDESEAESLRKEFNFVFQYRNILVQLLSDPSSNCIQAASPEAAGS